MQLSVRAKLFLVSLGLIVAVGGASFIYLEVELRRWLEELVERNLEQLAHGARETFLATPGLQDPEAIDRLAHRLGEASATRISVIDTQGRLLGDSSLDPKGLQHADNHAHRPEIEEAMKGGTGRARRYSTTVGSEMLYVALPYVHGPDKGVVRVAMPLRVVDEAIVRLRVLLVVAGMVGLAIAVLMSLLASHLLSRTLRKLVGNARQSPKERDTESTWSPPTSWAAWPAPSTRWPTRCKEPWRPWRWSADVFRPCSRA